jgi:hypothetical protein
VPTSPNKGPTEPDTPEWATGQRFLTADQPRLLRRKFARPDSAELGAHWLVGGYDGQALRALAGFNGTDPYEVRDTLPDALADCHTPIPDSDSAAAQATFTKLARMHADGAASEKWIIDKVDEILARTEYANSVINLPSANSMAWMTNGDKAGAEPHNNSRQRSNAHAPLNSPHARRLPPCPNQMKPHARNTIRRVAQDPLARPQQLIRALAVPEPGTIAVLGIDDFAFRKSHNYGSIVVDMQTHRPVDLLPDRLSDTFADWLRAHPAPL